MARFFVVNFEEEGSLAVVPEIWVSGDGMCAWPPFKGPQKIQKSVISCQIPDPSWQRIKARIMYRTESYEKARQKAKLAEDTSDLQSASETDVRKKRKKISYSSDDDDPPSLLQVNAAKIKKTIQYGQQPANVNASFCLIPSSSPLSKQPLEQGARNEIFQRKVFSLLENLTQEVKELKVLVSNRNLPIMAKQLPPGCPVLPLQNPEELIEFESFLEIEENLSDIATFMSTTGGSNAKDCTRRILQKVMTNPLSMKYNWKGSRGEKLPFSSFIHINKLISVAVRGHTEFRTATDVEISNITKKWLMHSKDRDGGRCYRKLNVNVMNDAGFLSN